MSKYCDYNLDSFEECLIKDKDLRNDFLDRLSPSYSYDYYQKRNKEKLISNIKRMIDTGNKNFTIESHGVSSLDVISIAEENRLYWNYDFDRDVYCFKIK